MPIVLTLAGADLCDDMGRAPCASQSPQDFTSCRAGARPGHPIKRHMQRSKSLLLDHLVGGHLHDQRHREAERLGGPKIDHQFELGWLQDRQVGWLCALENVPSVNARLAIGASNACPIAHQAAGFDVIAPVVNRWNGMARRECNQPLTLASREWTAADQQRARTRVDYL